MAGYSSSTTEYNKSTRTLHEAAFDDGQGNVGFFGAIDYATGDVAIEQVATANTAKYSSTRASSTSSNSGSGTESSASWDRSDNETNTPSPTVFTYIQDTAPVTARTAIVTVPDVQFYITPAESDSIMPGSLVFEWGGKLYQDFEGTILRDVEPGTNSGINAGAINYETGLVIITDWGDGSTLSANINILSLVTTLGDWTAMGITFRTAGAPIRPGGISIRATTAAGEFISAVATTGGQFTSPKINGEINQETGVANVEFTEPVDPSSIRYNATIQTTLPLSEDLLGIDPVRLPIDGRVAIFNRADIAIVHHTKTESLGVVAADQTINLAETRLTWVKVKDADGQIVPNDRYTVDLDAGTITFPSSLNLSGYTQPLEAEWRIHDQRLVVDIEIDGRVHLAGQLTHNYPANESYISSCVVIGDMQARVTDIFDQMNWTGQWADQLIGDETAAQFNDKNYPIIVTNRGAISERWFIEFTNSNSFRCIGETVGQISLGTTTEVFAPLNPETQVPYFVIDPLAWGSGWPNGSILRFNTVAAIDPVWCGLTTQTGASMTGSDGFTIEAIGNANKD